MSMPVAALDRYTAFLFRHARIVVAAFACLLILAALGLQGFRLDASAESLLLENDQALKDFRQVNDRFGSGGEYLVVTYSPRDYTLFSAKGIAELRALRDDLLALEGISSTVSMLDVPLLHSPELSLDNVNEEIKTIDEHGVDPQTAKQALLQNPLYPNLLVSEDGDTTAIQVFIATPEDLTQLFKQREALKQQRGQRSDPQLEQQLAAVHDQYIARSQQVGKERDALIASVREVIASHNSDADIFLGGIPMIAVDMIDYIESDISTFGIGVLLFLIATLWIIFRQWHWVAIPLFCCGCTVLLVAGYLGWRSWPVTVISSNFISLLLIMTLSLTIHVIVRYREYQTLQPQDPSDKTLAKAIQAMITPCFFMMVTTIVAFSSFTLSGILPVIDFGWMMTIGLVLAFLITFGLFPSLLHLFPPKAKRASSKQQRPRQPFTSHFAVLTQRHTLGVILGSIAIAALSLAGISRLTVENSFVDYFKSGTDIYQGMVTIDKELGGTTPLDIIITDQPPPEGYAEVAQDCDPFVEDCGEAAEYRDTWFTYDKMEQIATIHRYLESLEETGKVISIKTTLDLITLINGGRPLDDFELEFVPSQTPETLKEVLLTPYISEEHDQARISIRLIDSLPDLRRNELLNNIHHHLLNELGLPQERVLLSGMMVMYNNMLQSLFDSQIKTLGFVFIAILLVFLVLFRSLKLALIGMAPNVLSAAALLGLMGGLGIPLDLMTITVAAITIGIAVDDTIHFIHRFKLEIAEDGDYMQAMHRCHRSIGRAMFYTSLTIVMGFSILVLSNFLPTIYFGIFTGFAMMIALVFALTLLPALIVVFKPFGKGAPLAAGKTA